MGRNYQRRYLTPFGVSNLPRDRPLEPAKATPATLKMFVEKSRGPVAQELIQQDLFEYDAQGELRLAPQNVGGAIAQLQGEVFNQRQYTESGYKYEQAKLIGPVEGKYLTRRQQDNLTNRTMQARAQAIYAAASATGYKFSRTEREFITPIREGKYNDTVYGNQERQQTRLADRLRNSGQGDKYKGYNARAQELRENLYYNLNGEYAGYVRRD